MFAYSRQFLDVARTVAIFGRTQATKAIPAPAPVWEQQPKYTQVCLASIPYLSQFSSFILH